VTPEQNQKLPIYRWFNLNHSYSRNLVISLLEEYNFHSGQIVLDPFCGSGTTLLACREMGINALGVDIMPLSVFTSNSKLKPYAKQKISCDYEQIYPSRQYDFGFETADPYLHKCFPLDELTKLLHLRYTIASMSEPERNFFALALLKILEEISYTMNDGAFLRFSNQKRLKTLEQTFPQQVKLMMEDLETQKPNRTSAVTVQGDARCIPFKDRSVDGVITSPPYPNRHDYTRIYAVELLFSFLNNREELKRLRYSMIRSNVEARCVVRIKGYRPPTRLEKLLFRLKQCHLPNRKVVDMVSGYFEDMYGVMVEIARVCKSGAKIAFTVGNAKYGGIMFPVDELLAEIGENAGLKTVKIIVARYRGNSPQQMKKFGKESARESIIIWEREK
jgi:site-specific DNA-methyltransferase (cytosine-N4-specific)